MWILLLDMAVLVFLMNRISDEDWSDQKLKVFGIALTIALLGGIGASWTLEHFHWTLSLLSGFLIGLLAVRGFRSGTPGQALLVMAFVVSGAEGLWPRSSGC